MKQYFIKHENRKIVNHHTYLRGLTSKGTTACMKRFPERVGTEIKLPMDRITNLNSMVGSEVPCRQDMQGVGNYVVFSIQNQSKQPASSSRLIEEGPKGNNMHDYAYWRKRTEFGIFRNTKVWGKRRIHSTVFICGKGSSKFTIRESWFEGQDIKDQFQKLQHDVSHNIRVTNLTNILSEKNFLIGCYLNIKSKAGNMTKSLSPETLDGINMKWFDEVIHTFRNGKYHFKPSRQTPIPKPNGKLRPLTIPSPRDKIVQEGMRILLECVFNEMLCNSSHGFRSGRGCHTALNQVQLHFGKSNWFIEGDISQQYPSINHNILINILREKIQDEPFIDLVYKYMRVGYGETSNEILPMKIGLMQKGLISPILSNIYMHPFDVWIEDDLIPKYTKGKRKKANPEYTKMLRTNKKAVDKTVHSFIAKDVNYGRVHYVRYVDDFLIGVIGSKETCMEIRKEIKNFLENNLAMTLNIDKTKITHATTEKALFLGHNICCTPLSKMKVGYNSKNQLTRRTTRTVLNAPIKTIVEKLQHRGFLNTKGEPTRCGRYVNMDLWNIIDSYQSIQRGILNYYSMANNYGRLAARMHYSLKYSCALTISSKMKLRTLRGAFGRYGKNLTVKVGDKSISYSNISYKRPKKVMHRPNDIVSFEKYFDGLVYRHKRHVGNLEGPCIVCGCLDNIEVHHI